MGIRGTFGSTWLGATWSLAVEEQFYFMLPFLVYFMPKKWLFIFLCSQIIVAPLFRFIFPGFYLGLNIPWRADPLFAGSLLAWFVISLVR